MTPPVENTVWYLRQHRLFEGVNDETLNDSIPLFVQKIYPPNTILFAQGDPARVVYLVKRGKVRIARVNAEGKEITLGILGRGDIFGEELVFHDDLVRTTQATCIEETHLCHSRMEDLFGLLSRYPIVAINVARYLQEQRDAAMAIVEDLTFLRVPDRIIRLFERLGHDHGTADPRGRRIDMRLTHAEIAALIGCTRETVSLELGRLVRAGRILSDKGSFVLVTDLQPA